jgi:hypothetical protein
MTPGDQALVQKIEKIMKEKLPKKTLPDFDYAVPKPENQQQTRNRRPRQAPSR